MGVSSKLQQVATRMQAQGVTEQLKLCQTVKAAKSSFADGNQQDRASTGAGSAGCIWSWTDLMAVQARKDCQREHAANTCAPAGSQRDPQ